MHLRLASLATLAVVAPSAPSAAQTTTTFSASGPGATLVDYTGPIIWDGGLPAAFPPQPAFTADITVPNDVVSIQSVVLSGMVSTDASDLNAILRDPTGKGYDVFVRPGFSCCGGTGGAFTTGGNPGSTLTFVPSGGLQMPFGGDIPTGTYNQDFGTPEPFWPHGYLDVYHTGFASITGPPGNWKLEIWDWDTYSSGSIGGWTVDFEIVVTGGQFCYGDGTDGPCPCSNQGTPGRGCENSASTGGARLTGTGHPRLSGDTVVLRASGMLPTVNCIYLQGDAAVAPLTFGDGLRCAGGVLKRLYLKGASGGVALAPNVGGGDETVSARSATLGDPLSPGLSRHYQTYYRDPNPGFCASPPGNTWNVTSGLTITWAP